MPHRSGPTRATVLGGFLLLLGSVLAVHGSRVAAGAILGPSSPRLAETETQEASASYVLRTVWRSPPTFTGDGEVFDPDQIALEPIDVALDATDRLLVADAGGRLIRVYDADPTDASGLMEVARWSAPAIEGERYAGVPIVPYRIAADRPRARVHVLWRALTASPQPPPEPDGDQWLVSYAEDGTPLGPPRAWPGAGRGSALDITVDPDSGEVVGFQEHGCLVLRWPPAASPSRRPATVEAGCADPRIAMGADGQLALLARTTWGLRVLQLSAAGRERGALSLSRHWPLDVSGGLDAEGGVHVLTDSPPGTPELALLLRFDEDRNLLVNLALRGPGDPRIGERGWPHAVDVAGDRVAFTSYEDGPAARIYDPSTGDARVLHGASGLTRPTYGIPPGSDWQSRSQPNVALAGLPSGGVMLLDHRVEHFYRRSVGEAPLRLDAPTDGAEDFALAPDGSPIVVEAEQIVRHGDAGWRVDCACGDDPRIAVGRESVFVAPDGPLPVEERALADGSRTGLHHGVGSGEGVPADLALGGGWLLAANYERPVIDGWLLQDDAPLASNRPDRSWVTGSIAGIVRLAATEGADGARGVALVGTRSGLAVEILDLATGVRVARVPLGSIMDPTDPPVDVALDGRGWLYVSGESGAVYVFEPAAAGAPSPTPDRAAPVPTPDPSASCRPRGTTRVDPARIPLGDTTSVSLEVSVDCPRRPVGHGSDIVLVVDSSGSMKGTKLAAALAAAQEFIRLVDLGLHQVAVVDFDSEARVVAPLGVDAAAAISATAVITGGGGTFIWGALRTSEEHLAAAGRERAQPVVVLLSDGKGGGESVVRQGQRLRARGFAIYTVGLGEDADHRTLQRLAGDPRRYHFAPGPSDLQGIYEAIRLAVEEGAQPLAFVDDVLAPDLALIHGSADPAALEGARSLRWQVPLAAPARTVFSATFELRPLRAGLLPVHERLEVTYSDVDGVERSHGLAQVFVEVVGPTATSTPLPSATPPPTPTATRTRVPSPTATAAPSRTPPPTATPTPSATRTATRTSTATPSPAPSATAVPPTPSASPTAPPTPTRVRLHLPLALHEPSCERRRQAVNVALVIDASGSMAQAAPGGGTKIEAAAAAVRRFLGHLRLEQGDQAALVAFNERATVLEPLTSDGTRLELALLRLRLDPGTRIDRALAAGRTALLRGGLRPANARVLLLLTDGRSSEPPDAALRVAALARGDAITFHAIALGREVDAAHLAAIAGDPARLHLAPSASDLAAIYERVAREIPCPREGYWGRR